jgi:hypothetical protein
MVGSVHEVAKCTEMNIRYNALIIQKIALPGNFLIPEVPHIATFTAYMSDSMWHVNVTVAIRRRYMHKSHQ